MTNAHRVKNSIIRNVVIAQRHQTFNLGLRRGKPHVIEFQRGEFSGDRAVRFRPLQILIVSRVNLVIQFEPFTGGNPVRMRDTNLRHHTDRLRKAPGFFRFNLRAVRHVTRNVLRQLQKIVGRTDSQFIPAHVVEEGVRAVGEVRVNPDVREHHQNRLAAFDDVDVFLNVDFIEFRTLQKRNLFHQLNIRKFHIRNRIEEAVFHQNLPRGIHPEQRTQFNAAVLVAADIIGQPFFHLDETPRLVERPERRDLTGTTQFFDQSVTRTTLLKKRLRDFDRLLRRRNLEIGLHHIKRQILRRTIHALLAHQHTILSLLRIEKRQTEVQYAQSQVHVKIIDVPILTGAVAIGQTTFSDLLTRRRRHVAPTCPGIGNIQFRKHAEHFRRAHLASDILFQIQNLHVKVVFKRETDAIHQADFFALRQLLVFGGLKMSHRILSTFVPIIFGILATADRQHPGNRSGASQPEQYCICFLHRALSLSLYGNNFLKYFHAEIIKQPRKLFRGAVL